MSKNIYSLKSYVEHIMGLREKALLEDINSYQWFFRGQENSSWSVYPNVFRNDGLAKETQIIQSALRQNPYEFQNESPFEILTKLQHYGLGTRLLDVTLNPLVALYFATEPSVEYKINKNGQFSKEEKDGVVFYKFGPWHPTNELSIRIASSLPFFDIDSSWTINVLLKELIKCNAITQQENEYLEKDNYKVLIDYLQDSYFVISSHSNERLIRQSGAFVIPTFINVADGVDISNCSISKSFKTINEEFSKDFFIIPAKSKKLIRDELDFFNINEATLFPELEHQMTYIKQRNVPIIGEVPEFVRYNSMHASREEVTDYNQLEPDVEKIVNELCASLSGDLKDSLVVSITNMINYVDWKQKTNIRSQIKLVCKRMLQEELSVNDSLYLSEKILINLLSPSLEMSKDYVNV